MKVKSNLEMQKYSIDSLFDDIFKTLKIKICQKLLF